MNLDEDEFQILCSSQDYRVLENQVQNLKGEKVVLNEENKELKEKLFEALQDKKEIEKRLVEMNDNITYLSEKVLQLSKSMILLNKQKDDIEMTNIGTEKELLDKYQESLKDQQKLELKLCTLEAEKSQLSQNLLMIKKKMVALTNKAKENCHIQTQTNSQDKFVQSSSQLSNTCVNTVETSESLESSFNEHQQIVSILEKQITNLSQQIRSLKKQKSQSQNCITSNSGQMKQLTHKLQVCQKKSKDYELLVNQLKQQLLSLQKQTANQQKDYEKLKKQNEVLNNEKNNQNMDIKKLLQQMSQMKKQTTNNQARFEKIKKDNQQISNNTEQLINSIENDKIRISEQLQKEKQITALLKTQIDNKAVQNDLKEKINLLKKQIKEITYSSNLERESLRKQLINEKNSTQNLRSDIEELRNTVLENNERQKAFKEDLKAKQKQTSLKMQEMQTNLKDKDQIIDELKKKVNNFKNERLQFKLKIEELNKNKANDELVEKERKKFVEEKKMKDKLIEEYESIIAEMNKEMKQKEAAWRNKEIVGKQITLNEIKGKIYKYLEDLMAKLTEMNLQHEDILTIFKAEINTGHEIFRDVGEQLLKLKKKKN